MQGTRETHKCQCSLTAGPWAVCLLMLDVLDSVEQKGSKSAKTVSVQTLCSTLLSTRFHKFQLPFSIILLKNRHVRTNYVPPAAKHLNYYLKLPNRSIATQKKKNLQMDYKWKYDHLYHIYYWLKCCCPRKSVYLLWKESLACMPLCFWIAVQQIYWIWVFFFFFDHF